MFVIAIHRFLNFFLNVELINGVQPRTGKDMCGTLAYTITD